MVQIKALDSIDENKLRELFKKRSHGILSPGFLDHVKEVLEGKHQGLEIHQCSCGELMILSKAHANSLKKKYRTEDIPCKVCRGDDKQIVNFEFLDRFREITIFLDERSVFVSKSKQTLKPEDVEALGKMALGLFPTNTHAEMLVGYYDFMKVFFGHFPKARIKTLPEVKELFDNARKMDEGEFERLCLFFLDWEKSHKATMNIYGKQDILSILDSKDSLKSLKDNLVENQKVDIDKIKIQLELSAYQDTVEIDVYLDLLANLLRILRGEKTIANPFSVGVLPPLKKGGQLRKVRSLADKVGYLQNNLPFKIEPMYNTHLRNAVAHNEFEIRVQEKRILLTKYSESLTFDRFHQIFQGLKKLHGTLNDYLADYDIARLRSKAQNQGVAAAILGFTDFFEEKGKQHPKPPCDAQLSIYQYWNFVTFDGGVRVFPKFEMQIDEKKGSLTVDFGENGALFTFPEGPEFVEWIEQLILTEHVTVALYTIAPTLPFFSPKAIMRCAVGKIMDIYVLSVDSKTVSISPQLMTSALKFLK